MKQVALKQTHDKQTHSKQTHSKQTHSKQTHSKQTHSKQLAHKQIHSQALAAAARYKKSEVELIEMIEKVDRHKVYIKYGYNSLFRYVNEGLKLSHEVTSIYINVARKTREIPALKEEIKKGTITVSKARRISSVMTPENKDHWLELAINSPKHQLEKAVAAASPKFAVREKMNFIHQTQEVKDKAQILKLESDHLLLPNPSAPVRVQLQVGISEELMLRLRRVQDLMSGKLKKPASLEESIVAMTDLFIKKHDPLEKAKRQKIRGKLNVDDQRDQPSSRVDEVSMEANNAQALCPGHNSLCKSDPSGSSGSRLSSLESYSSKLRSLDSCSSKLPNLDSYNLKLCDSRSQNLKLGSSDTDNLKLRNSRSQILKLGSSESYNSKLRDSGAQKLKLRTSDSHSSKLRNVDSGDQRKEMQARSTRAKHATKRKPLSAKIKHQIVLKHNGRCAHRGEGGQVCGEKRFLEIHHKVPLAEGGVDHIENLTLLCSGHHKLQHMKG